MKELKRDKELRDNFLDSFFGDKPIKELPTDTLSESAWENIRNALIAVGGSDIGVVMDFSEYKIKRSLWYQKLGVLDRQFKGNKYTFMGKFMEDAIGELWTYWDKDWDKTMQNYNEGIQTRAYQSRGMIFDPERPYIIGNLDGNITVHPVRDDEGVLEIKKMTGMARDKYDGRINPGHIFQIQGYMMITGAEYAELAIMENALDMDVYYIEASETIQEAIDTECRKFVEALHRGFEILATEKNQTKRLQYLSEVEPDATDSALLSEFYTKKRKALEVEKREMPATQEFWDLVIDRQLMHKQVGGLKDEIAVLDSKIKGEFDKNQVTRIVLDEKIDVRFYDRLWFHPKIKTELL